jgi:predicted MFS family arabinose efflux permease
VSVVDPRPVMQIAFGPIVAAYLVVQGGRAEDIGFALSIGGTASLVSQAPGGELVDSVRAKRLLVAAGVVAVALSVLIPWLLSSFPLVARRTRSWRPASTHPSMPALCQRARLRSLSPDPVSLSCASRRGSRSRTLRPSLSSVRLAARR